MEAIFNGFAEAHMRADGYRLARTIIPEAPSYDPDRLIAFSRSSTNSTILADVRYATIYNDTLDIPKPEGHAWVDVFAAYWTVICKLQTTKAYTDQIESQIVQWSRVYDAWKDVANALIRGYSNGVFASWTIPCLYVAGKYLRIFAIKADEQAAMTKGDVTFDAAFQDDTTDTLSKNEKLEDAARQINRIFSLCLSDRAPIEESRKWAVYYTTNLLFKIYFKLNSISLSKNILRSIQASNTDMPPLEAFPRSHIVTFKYYVGVIAFLEENYITAAEHLSQALHLCQRSAAKNRELILTYLIPTRLLTRHILPTQILLKPYPRLQQLFTPLCACIKRGDLAGFDSAIIAGQDEFVKRRIYLTLERGRDIALRNLFRRMFLAGGPNAEGTDRRTRIPVEEFAAALQLGMGKGYGGEVIDRDEVECLIANMIYKNLMKGYISRERAMVVLSKGGSAFPGTGV